MTDRKNTEPSVETPIIASTSNEQLSKNELLKKKKKETQNEQLISEKNKLYEQIHSNEIINSEYKEEVDFFKNDQLIKLQLQNDLNEIKKYENIINEFENNNLEMNTQMGEKNEQNNTNKITQEQYNTLKIEYNKLQHNLDNMSGEKHKLSLENRKLINKCRQMENELINTKSLLKYKCNQYINIKNINDSMTVQINELKTLNQKQLANINDNMKEIETLQQRTVNVEKEIEYQINKSVTDWISLSRCPASFTASSISVPSGVDTNNYLTIDYKQYLNTIAVHKYDFPCDDWIEIETKRKNYYTHAEYPLKTTSTFSAAMDTNKQILLLSQKNCVTQISLNQSEYTIQIPVNYDYNPVNRITAPECSKSIIINNSLFIVGGSNNSSILKWDLESKILTTFSDMYN
eukprot:426272_1